MRQLDSNIVIDAGDGGPESLAALLLVVTLGDGSRLAGEIQRLADVLRMTARRNKRRVPSTFELLDDPSRLEYSLT